MKTMDLIAATLVIVGGINWGLMGIAGFDLVAALFGEMSALTRLVYVLVGVSAVYELFTWRSMQRRWAHARP
jgi:hypothetical protein